MSKFFSVETGNQKQMAAESLTIKSQSCDIYIFNNLKPK